MPLGETSASAGNYLLNLPTLDEAMAEQAWIEDRRKSEPQTEAA